MISSKSILFKISKFPQPSETFVVNQVVTAIELGYEVKILVGELNSLSENADERILNKYKFHEKILIEEYGIPKRRFPRLLKALLLFIKNLKYLKSLIKFYKELGANNLSLIFQFDYFKQFRDYDLIHVQFGTNKNPIDVLKKINFYRNRLIVSFHGHDVHFPINNVIPNNGYYDRLFNVADQLIVNTLFLKEKLDYLGAPENKIKVIPVAVNTALFTPGSTENLEIKKFKIITVGRLNELKGQQYGIEAVKNLLNKGYEVEYIIAGTGPSESELLKQIQKERLTGNVFLKGKVTQQQIVELLQNSDVFLMTSVTNSYGMKESQGLVTAEAQACELPVIAFDSGGVKYTLCEGKTGFIVQERDVEAMVNKLEILLTNPNLRKSLGRNAREFIKKNFSTDYTNEVWRENYNHLITP